MSKVIVFTNGCFDMLHPGHVKFLGHLSELGHQLVVLLNSDDSVRKLKGLGRPVIPFEDRRGMLLALQRVDYAEEWNGEPEEMQRILVDDFGMEPGDIYAKGDDYTFETMDPEERKIIENAGAEIVFIPRYKDFSTTNLVNSLSAHDYFKRYQGKT